jgi:hemoglobin
MKKILSLLVLGLSIVTFAAETAAPAPLNTVCPITGKPANATITTVYEGKTYAFADAASKTKFDADRAASIYQQIGGKASMDAAIEIFYKKVLADDRVNHFFDDVSMIKQKRKQHAFISAALGAPTAFVGKDLRKAHADMDLTDVHFNAIAEHLQSTLAELKVPKATIDRILAIVETTRSHVLNRPEKS